MADDTGELGNQQKEQDRNAWPKHRARLAEDGLRSAMNTPRGRAFIWSVLERGQVFASTFHQAPSVAAFNEGRRALALELFADVMRLAPEHYVHMTGEAQKPKKDKDNDGTDDDTSTDS
jgi:hypothetical protein